MVVLKVIAKILLFPVVVALTVIQWVGIFLNSISGVILGILAFIFALTGISSLAFGLVSGPEAIKMIAAGFVIFMVPVIGEWLTTMIAAANTGLRDFIRS
ncbi:MAG: hypothetical protein IIY45_10680 [Firmicutes bacterium]|jgi:hypothetical protein|nr:hypothetical protein [Bacillota bacterium]